VGIRYALPSLPTRFSGASFDAGELRARRTVGRTHAPQQRAPSFDDLVGELLELHWHIKAERPGGLEVDHQLELDWGLDWKAKLLKTRKISSCIHSSTY
jgi:hypothetical protein